MTQSRLSLIIFLIMFTVLLLLDIGLNITEFFVNDGSISKTAIWTLIGSFTGAVVSFCLLVLWDKYKDHKYLLKKDGLILNSISHELEACLINCHECLAHLQSETSLMKNNSGNSTLIMPPPILHLEVWELLKYHIPSYLKEKPDIVVELRRASHRVSHFNNKLKSREDYHIHCKTLTNYKSDLTIFDDALIDDLNDNMVPMLSPLVKEFKPHCIMP